MKLKQFRRGMRYRFKTIKHRLRLQVRQLSRQGRSRKLALPPCDVPLPACLDPEREQPATEACKAAARPGASLPTLRRPANRGPVQ